MSDSDEIFDGCAGGIWRFMHGLFWLAVAVLVIGAIVVTAGGGGR